MIHKVEIGCGVRCVDYTPTGDMLAAGLKNGEVLILTVPSGKVWGRKRDRDTCINDIR